MEFWKFRILEILNFSPCKCISESSEREPLAELCDRCMGMLEGMDEEVRNFSISLLVTICRLLMTFANSLDPDQARQMSGLIWIQTNCHSDSLKQWYFTFCSGSSRRFTHSVNTQVILRYPTCFCEFITSNIFKTTQNSELKFSEYIWNKISFR